MNAAGNEQSDTMAAVPAGVVAEWLTPFLEYLAKERRYSRYTVRNYRQAFEDFWRWMAQSGLAGRGWDLLDSRECAIS